MSNKLNKPNTSFTFSLETPSLSSTTLEGYLKSIFGTESSNCLPEIFTSNKSDLTQPNPSNTSEKSNTTNNSSSSPSSSSSSVSNTNSQTISQQQIAPPVVVSISPNLLNSNNSDKLNSSSTSSSTQVVESSSEPINSNTGAIITTGETSELIPNPRGQSYVDITEYLNMPQSEAAKKLGIPASTLSKRWKEAVRKRKWPFRMVCKIDKEIMTLLHNVPQGPNAPPLPSEIEGALGLLLRKRQEELRSVVIRL